MAVDYNQRPIPGTPFKWKHHSGWRADCSTCAKKLTFNLFPSIADLDPSELASIWAMDMAIKRMAIGITRAALSHSYMRASGSQPPHDARATARRPGRGPYAPVIAGEISK